MKYLTLVLLFGAANTLAADEVFKNKDLDNQYKQNEAGQEAFEWEVSIGIGYSLSQSPYIGDKRQSEFVPGLSVSWGPLFFDGDSIGSYLYEQDNWAISASISINDSDRGDSAKVSDMTPLSNVVMANVNFAFEESWGALEASINHDVSHKYDGISADMIYSYPLYFEQWTVMPLVGFELFDKKTAQYYYGVSAENVKNSRPLYMPNAGVNYAIGINVDYEINENNTLSFGVSNKLYSDEIRKGSIVDKSNTMNANIIYYYTF